MATTQLAILETLFIVLQAAEASIYRTTVTTIETSDESSSSQQQQQCREQIQGQQLNKCRSFVQSSQSVLRLVVASPQQQTPPDECCEQLRNVDTECRCELINKMWRQMQQSTQSHGQQQEGQQQQMRKIAQFLPALCQMAPQVCTIEQTSVY